MRRGIGQHNTQRFAVGIPVDVCQIEESLLLILAKFVYLLCDDAF